MIPISSTLQTLIKERYFAAQHEFAQIQRNCGSEAAEEWLAEWGELHSVFASSVTQIALGVRLLAELHPASVLDITARKPQTHGAIDRGHTQRRRFVAFNMVAPNHKCTQPECSTIFCPQSDFPLQAIIIETGLYQERKSAEVTLVFPAWSDSLRQVQPNSLVFIRIQPTGQRIGSLYQFAGLSSLANADEHLRLLLGMTPSLGLETSSTEKRGDISSVLGFKKAEEYLAQVIPYLGDYLIGLADASAPGHTRPLS